MKHLNLTKILLTILFTLATSSAFSLPSISSFSDIAASWKNSSAYYYAEHEYFAIANVTYQIGS